MRSKTGFRLVGFATFLLAVYVSVGVDASVTEGFGNSTVSLNATVTNLPSSVPTALLQISNETDVPTNSPTVVSVDTASPTVSPSDGSKVPTTTPTMTPSFSPTAAPTSESLSIAPTGFNGTFTSSVPTTSPSGERPTVTPSVSNVTVTTGAPTASPLMQVNATVSFYADGGYQGNITPCAVGWQWKDKKDTNDFKIVNVSGICIPFSEFAPFIGDNDELLSPVDDNTNTSLWCSTTSPYNINANDLEKRKQWGYCLKRSNVGIIPNTTFSPTQATNTTASPTSFVVSSSPTLSSSSPTVIEDSSAPTVLPSSAPTVVEIVTPSPTFNSSDNSLAPSSSPIIVEPPISESPTAISLTPSVQPTIANASYTPLDKDPIEDETTIGLWAWVGVAVGIALFVGIIAVIVQRKKQERDKEAAYNAFKREMQARREREAAQPQYMNDTYDTSRFAETTELTLS